jgi:hypothetical protein
MEGIRPRCRRLDHSCKPHEDASAHRIPLASQTISVLEELRTLTGQFELLFPGVRSPSRPLSENTLNAALRRLGYAKDDMSSHGFRAAASSLLNECGKWNADAIEAQLAHVEANAVRKAYARAEYWAERVEMMAYWANRLDELRRGGIIVPLRARVTRALDHAERSPPAGVYGGSLARLSCHCAARPEPQALARRGGPADRPRRMWPHISRPRR